jgi:thioredoxin
MRALLVTLATCALVLPGQAKYSGGTGEPNDPYQIAATADLIALGNEPNDYDKHFILTADIDLDPNLPGRKVFDRAVIAPDVNDADDWFEGTSFVGVFDGAGHEISHLTITGGDFLGLFGQVVTRRRGVPAPAAVVKNLAVVGVRITGTGDYVGGLVGHNIGATVTQCYTSGVVSGNLYVGGLVGMESTAYGGGGRTISDCYSTAAVSATTGSAGGLVGYNVGSIMRCYSTGPVSAPVGAGGLVGGEYGGTVTDCFWDIETSGLLTSARGTGKTTLEMHAANTFVLWGACVSVWTIDDGRDYPRLAWENAPGQIVAGPTYAGGSGTAEDPYRIATAEDLDTLGLCSCQRDKHFELIADIDLSRWTRTGSVIPSFSGVFDGDGHILSGLTITGGDSLGLFGQLASGAYVKNLGVVDVNITASGVGVGGLAGRNDGGTVTHCFSTGYVGGNGRVGGLIGSNDGDVSWCYSTCGVGGDQYIGGLLGSNSGDMMHCYSAGPVIGNSFVGGLAGDGSPKGAMHCVWDVEASGLTGSAGGAGLTTAEMMDANMLGLNGFAEDPNWVLDAHRDYPRLAWEGTAGTIIPEPSVDWLEGQGTADEPYRIDTSDQLILLGKAGVLWDRHFVLGTDIDLDPNLPERAIFRQGVVPAFSGVFDGNGHAISHLTIQGGSYLGLFGWVADPSSEIRNLSLIDPNMGGANYIGALAGWMENGTILDCSILGGRVSGNSYVGGLVGNGSRIIGCSVEQVEVVLTGYLPEGVGGLTFTAKEIVDCRVTGGLVRGSTDVGGLAARMGGTISGCCTSTRIETGEQGISLWLNMGGLVGNNAGTVEDSYSTSSVTQTDPSTLLALLPSGVGGLVGWNDGMIRRSYSTGTVVASAGGALPGTELDVGGLVGLGLGHLIESSFWDIETSGQATSAGGTGKTTAEMQMAETFLDVGWDFVGETANGTEDIWWIDEGRDYPRLAWEREELIRLPVVELDAAGFDAAIAEGVILVDLYATWCSACARQAPILEEVADRLQGRARVGKLDVDKATSIAQRYGVTAIPTLILFRDGVEVTRFIGVTDADVLTAAILATVDSLE